MFVCVVLSTYLSWGIKYVYVGLHNMYVWVCVEPLYQLAYILICSFWETNGLSHFGGVICSLQFTILKMCVHEEYHLVLIYKYYLISMWYVMLMRNSNSIISINYLLLDYIKWIIILLGSNKLCAYYKPRKCEHERYCHLELIFSISCSSLACCSNKFQFG